MPSKFQAMEEIELPLKVADYVQPFPSLVVKTGGEYHFVLVERHVLRIGAFTTKGEYESCTMMNLERTIESYLGDPKVITTIPLDDHREAHVMRHEPEMIPAHRFRATLNFLLLCTMEGVVAEKVKLPEHLKRNPIARLAKPQLYRPQDIELLRKRYDRDVRPEDSGTGTPNRPHWRRAHWRRARVGVGHNERRLVFVRACFIHKELMGGSFENTAATYSCKARDP
jgi:hypothetical protein